MSAERDEIVAWLDETLDLGAWSDKSLNGLQVEGDAEVRRVAVAVDAAMATFLMTAEAEAEMLVVHHGLFWGSAEPVTGPLKARLMALLEEGISLYAAHLPLDGHRQLGNNAVLSRLLELRETSPFGEYGGVTIGVRGTLPEPVDREELAAKLEALLDARPDVLPFGPASIRTVAVVSGDAAGLVPDAAAAGVDAFVTGESDHVAWHAAREHGVNLVFAGHYATETLGVRALGDAVAERFGIEAVFLDAPTGY